jgi:hypothetical protein
MVLDRVHNGFEFYLITIMFCPLPGSAVTKQKIMMEEVERIYATLLTRVIRKPKSTSLIDLPLWIVCPDFPVPKYAKQSLPSVSINQGLHVHALALVPPITRLKRPLDAEIRRHQELLTKNQDRVFRLHAEVVTHDEGYVVGYAMKSLVRRRSSSDSILILPRTSSELAPRRGVAI